MEDFEDQTEKVQEHVLHQAQHQRDSLTVYVALTAALLAACAAVTSLLAGHHSNEAMIEQLKASDQWSLYQAKGIKSAVLSAKRELLLELNGKITDNDNQKIDQYKSDQDVTSEKARELEKSSEEHLRLHLIFARGVTMFQLAIAIAAVSALSRKKLFWYVSLGFGAIGLFFLSHGLL